MSDGKIIVNYINPPIPLRCFDYTAVREGYDEGDIIGFGKTAEDAKRDLLHQERGEWGECYWCQKGLKEKYIVVEGFVFCDESCEGEYYSDRNHRRKNNLRPLWMDRRDNTNQKPAGQE